MAGGRSPLLLRDFFIGEFLGCVLGLIVAYYIGDMGMSFYFGKEHDLASRILRALNNNAWMTFVSLFFGWVCGLISVVAGSFIPCSE